MTAVSGLTNPVTTQRAGPNASPVTDNRESQDHGIHPNHYLIA